MNKIRVLIVDDSTVIRRLVTESLGSDPQIEVIGTAADGKIALAKIPLLNPDVITLDVEMPQMDGLETLLHLRKAHPKLPVIMFSTLTERGASATLDALARGASDYVAKPANVGSVTAAIQTVRDELIPKIKALAAAGHSFKRFGPAPSAPVARVPLARPTLNQRVDVLTIGVSTGGPNALAEVLPRLPANLPVPVVIVQHMPPIFTKHLSDRLNHLCKLNVAEAIAGEELSPGKVRIAPGGKHLVIRRQGQRVITDLNEQPPENSCRPAVDVLFRSVVDVYGAATLAVILTGMGQDGLVGARRVREVGGQVLAQDQASSVVWGMPGAVAQDGLAQSILPLANMAGEIERLCLIARIAPRIPFALAGKTC